VTDRIFATAGGWAVGADELQWMLMRRIHLDCWDPVSFVHSTRDVLARCMREKGVAPGTAAQLLSGLSETFDRWKANQSPSAGAVQAAACGRIHRTQRTSWMCLWVQPGCRELRLSQLVRLGLRQGKL
jgi:hypothetical protein